MDSANNKAPAKITDTTEAICARCKAVSYKEEIITTLCDNGDTKYERIVTGGFKQSCDYRGTPNGAVIPLCKCREIKNA